MLYQICNGRVQFAAEVVLDEVQFEIREKEKIAIVGRNGCGKTTLLKLISGEIELTKRDSDEDIYIAKAGNPSIGYLKQMAFETDAVTLDEEIRKVFKPILKMQEELNDLLEEMNQNPTEKNIQKYVTLQETFEDKGGYYYEKEYKMFLKKFGFQEQDKNRKLSEFSGGQRTKIAFMKLLLSKPDILLLDEPTNHLDIETTYWLEEYLKGYQRAVVIVSHDRMFLDHIVDVVYEIEYKRTRRYPGNYSDFVKRKREDWEKQQKDYLLQQKEIKRLETIVDKFKNKPTKVAMTRSKLKQIEHMDKIEAPKQYDMKSFQAKFTPKRETGKDVLQVMNLQIGYEKVLSEVSFQLSKGQKIGIIGGNGLGKSTLLKTLVGQLEPLGGSYNWGYQVDIGYFEQQMAQFTGEESVIDHFWNTFPTLSQTEIRSALGAFLFTKDDVFKSLSMLSGGEKGRLALAKIFKYRPNVLLLDEPTNHMDIVGKEALENMLKTFEGSVLFVSHDRFFVKQVADALLVFEEEGVIYYPFGYEAYLEKKTERLAVEQNIRKEEIHAEGMIKSKSCQASDQTLLKEQARNKRKIEKLEQAIEESEEKLQALNEVLMNPEYSTDFIRLQEVHDEISRLEEQLQEQMKEWTMLEESFGI